MNDVLTVNDVRSIINTLWSPLADGSKPNVFMVLDGARDKRIEPLINNSNVEQSCLYAGNLSYKLKRAAPHIVKLSEDSDLTAKILTMGWGKSWGIFLLAKQSTSMKSVRANCRRLAKVKSVTGKNLVFRYYDPRVTRLMLPVCNQHEVDCILGESISLLIEQKREQTHQLGFTLFERGDEKTPVIVKDLSFEENNQSLKNKLNQGLLSGIGKNPEHSWRNFFQLRQEHMDALQNKLNDEEFTVIKDDYIEFYIKGVTNIPAINNSEINSSDIEEQAPVDNSELSNSDLSFSVGSKSVDLDTYLRFCFNKAKEFKLDSRDSILTFINMNQQYGWLFWTKNEYTWVEDILLSGRPCEAKMEAINKKFSRILMDRMWS